MEAMTTSELGFWEKDENITDTVTFGNLPSGTYNLAIDVDSDNYVDVETVATVAKGEAKELQITVDEVAAQRNVNFRVINENNSNVDDAKVVVFNEDGTIKDVLTTTDGTDELKLVAGNYTLAVYQNGYKTYKTSVTVSGKDITVPVIQLAPIK